MNKQCKKIYEANKAKGFWQHREAIPTKMALSGLFSEDEIIAVTKAFKGQAMMLIVTELAEVMEADRKDLMDDKLPHRSGEEVEMADAMIRIKDYAGGYNLDIEGAEQEKLEYNSKRPYLHGKQY